jgi:hypothetical protein
MPTAGELKRIWAAAREIGLGEEALRNVVEDVSGQRSLRALSQYETGRVIDCLVRAGARPARAAGEPAGRGKASGRRQTPGVVRMVTPAQRAYIADLRGKLGGDWLSDRYYEGACLKLLGKAVPTTSSDGSRVVQMLKIRLGASPGRAGLPAGPPS